MSNTTLRKLHQQKKPGHRRRLFILQEIQNLLQITLTSVPWIPTDSEKPAHLLWRVGCITGRFASAQIDEFRNSLVPRSCTFPLYCLRRLRGENGVFRYRSARPAGEALSLQGWRREAERRRHLTR
jgi:hypothetical protein